MEHGTNITPLHDPYSDSNSTDSNMNPPEVSSHKELISQKTTHQPLASRLYPTPSTNPFEHGSDPQAVRAAADIIAKNASRYKQRPILTTIYCWLTWIVLSPGILFSNTSFSRIIILFTECIIAYLLYKGFKFGYIAEIVKNIIALQFIVVIMFISRFESINYIYIGIGIYQLLVVIYFLTPYVRQFYFD